jgi:C4-dicarboxylate-specific signal transduction histidine kinase
VSLLTSNSIRRQVLTATAIILVLLLGAVAWSASRTLAERQAEVRDEAAAAATLEAASLNQLLNSFDSIAAVLAVHPAVTAFDRPQADRLFAAVLRDQPALQNVLLTSPTGAVRASGLPPPPANLPQPATPFVADVVRTGKPVISDFNSGPETTIMFAYPMRNADGAVAGVLGLTLNLERVQSAFDAIPLPERSIVLLTDARGRLLVGSSGAVTIVDPQAQEAASPSAPPRAVGTGLDNVERYFGNTLIDRGPLLLSIGIPARAAYLRTRPLWRRNVAIVLMTMGTLLGLSLFLARLLSHDLDRLRLAVQRIAGGDLSPPVAGAPSNFELASLQSSFIQMAANLKEMHEALDRQVTQERKMRETVQSLQRQVVRQERLTAVGLLVSGVAHELNNPLQAILGTAELLERDPALTADVKDEIAFVKTQSGRARDIIRNLSRFSSQQSGPPAYIDLRDVVQEVVHLRQRELDGASIALEVDAAETRTIYANFTEVEQVALNFVINAQQSIEAVGRGGGRIVIRVSEVGRKVRLEVLDNGTGVSPDDEAKLFQPFFTTKPVGKGTGLGLSVSYGIIDSYGGVIGYRNNDLGGATFFFELPWSEKPVSANDGQAVLH